MILGSGLNSKNISIIHILGIGNLLLTHFYYISVMDMGYKNGPDRFRLKVYPFLFDRFCPKIGRKKSLIIINYINFRSLC